MKKTTMAGIVGALVTAVAVNRVAMAEGKPAEKQPTEKQPTEKQPTEEQPDTLVARMAPSPGGGLTSEQVSTRAQETSFDAAARRQALASADARLDQAKVAYYPRLTLTASYTRISEMSQTLSFAGQTIVFPLNRILFQAGMTIPVSDYVLRLSQSYAAASRNQRAAQLDQQAAKLKAGTDGKLAYYRWLRAKGQLIVAERALAQSKAHLDDANYSFEAGTASKADVLRVESQVATAEVVVAQAQNVLSLNEEQIRTAMHDASTEPYKVGEDLRIDPPPVPGLDNLEALRAEALEQRLEVRALDETAWSFREQAKVARAGYYPRLDVFGNAIYANPNPRVFIPANDFRPSWEAGAQLVWTPNDTLNAGGASADAEARAAQTQAQRQLLRDSVGLEVVEAFNSMREAEITLGTTARGLRAAEEGYRVRRELFRNGRATSVELTDSEVELFRASLEAINARANLRSARASLLHAVGRDIPSVMAKR